MRRIGTLCHAGNRVLISPTGQKRSKKKLKSNRQHAIKKKRKIIGKKLLWNDNFSLGASGFMVPTKPGPCLKSLEALHVLPHFANTSEMAKTCIANKIANVFFGLTWVKRFGRHKLFRLHMQTTPGVHFTELTKNTLPKLIALISTWGEAQGKKKKMCRSPSRIREHRDLSCSNYQQLSLAKWPRTRTLLGNLRCQKQ